MLPIAHCLTAVPYCTLVLNPAGLRGGGSTHCALPPLYISLIGLPCSPIANTAANAVAMSDWWACTLPVDGGLVVEVRGERRVVREGAPTMCFAVRFVVFLPAGCDCMDCLGCVMYNELPPEKAHGPP
jgi:hypothetical protein